MASIASLTIPGTHAYHVVGDTPVTLAEGDLTVIIPSMTNPISTAKTPVLMITVGRAAFPLYSTTVFGTIASDERVYLFQPELGKGVSGYVKIVLPDGVREPGSEFNALQERFEKVLISRGLLREGEGSSERSVTIHSVVATHVLGKTTVELARGDMTLSTTTPETNQRVKDPKAILVLSVGEASFPLHLTTLFGTVAGDERVYVFRPEIHDGETPQGGYVKITLPERTTKALKSAQEKFEEMLVDYGLLKTGVEAASDEISRSISEESAAVAISIRKSTAEYLTANHPTDSPVVLPRRAHALSTSTWSATSSVHSATQDASSEISSTAGTVGASAVSSMTGGPPSPSTTAAASAVADAYHIVGKGAAEVAETLTESFGAVVQNELGPEVRDVGGNLAGSVSNVSGALAQVAEIGTGAVLVSGGVKGAVGLHRDDESADATVEDLQAGDTKQLAEEMATFSIEEKDADAEGEWKDVSI